MKWAVLGFFKFQPRPKRPSLSRVLFSLVERFASAGGAVAAEWGVRLTFGDHRREGNGVFSRWFWSVTVIRAHAKERWSKLRRESSRRWCTYRSSSSFYELLCSYRRCAVSEFVRFMLEVMYVMYNCCQYCFFCY